jgi:hypothetical protein
MTSCAKDACKNTVCNNGGTCNDGTCICAPWFEGTNCSTEQRTKYYAVYVGEFELFDNQGNVVYTDPMTFTVIPGPNVNQLELNGIGATLGNYDATVPLTTSGTGNFSRSYEEEFSGEVYEIVENGSFSGDLLEYNYYSDGELYYKFIGFR